VPDIAKLQVVVAADTSDAEAGFGRVNSAIGGFGKIAGAALLGAGAAIVGAGAAAVAAASGFEATMSGVKAVSGATATEMKGLSGLALQLGKDTAFSASEAGAGIEELVKGGLSISDIMGGAAKATLNLAAAGGVSLPEAATIAANALSQFSLKGKDMAHVSDLIAGAANASAIDVNDFKFSLASVGAVAAGIGLTFDSTAVAIAELGAAGIKGSDAGTSLKAMLLNLSPSTKKATEEMKDLGIITATGANQFFDAQGKVKDFAAISQVLQTATKGLTEEQRINALQTLFGTDGMRAALIATKEGSAGYGEMAGAMGKVSAEAVGLEKLNNLQGDIKTVGGSVETWGITFGTVFLPALRDATQWVTNLVNGMIPWVERVGPQIVLSIQQLGDAFGDLFRTGDIGVFADDLGESFGLDLSPFVLAIRTVEEVIGKIATGFREGGLGGAFAAWLGEAGRFGSAILAWIGDQVNPVLTKLGEWGNAFVAWIAPKIAPMLTEAGKLATRLWTWITDTAAPTVLEKLTTWGSAFTAWVSPMIPPFLVEVGKIATALGTWITDTAAPLVLTKLGAWKDQFVAWIGPATDAFLLAWPANLTRFLDWIEFTAAPAITTTLASWVKSFVAWVGGADGTGEGTAAGGLFKTLGNIASVVWSFISKTAEVLGPRLASWAGKFLGWVATDVVPFLATELGKMLVAIGTWIVTDAAPWALEHMKDFGAAIVRGIVAGILGMPNAIGDALKSLVVPTSLPTPAPAAPAAPVARGPSPRAGEVVAQGPNFSGQYLYTSDGGRHGEWRDQGGPGYAGQSYMIGTGAQPERFVPDRPGHFYPNGGGGGGDTHVTVRIGEEVLATVVAKANQRYANRGGR